MKYKLKLEIEDEPECKKCLLAEYNYNSSLNLDKDIYNCIGRANRAICKNEGRRNDCPLIEYWLIL